MKFGLFAGLRGMTFETVIELCRHAEAAGWDAACFPDHFAPNTEDGCGDNLECWTTLASLAMVTTRIRIGTIVSSNTFRHPALLAKMAANVDISSRGRLICGLGAGWQENEHLMCRGSDLFSGAGGFSLGFLAAGCQIPGGSGHRRCGRGDGAAESRDPAGVLCDMNVIPTGFAPRVKTPEQIGA